MQEYLDKLNPEQKEMAATLDGPVFTLAGAGSGKTYAMITRLANMIDKGIDPSSILLLTFTNKAADEMKERAKLMVGEQAENITACTYHSFCVQMLRKYSGYAGLRHDFTVISQGDAESAVSLIKTEFKYNKIKGFPQTKTISGWISATINTDATFRSLMEKTKYSPYINDVAKIKERYIEYKKEREYLDYDDMLVLFYEAIKSNRELAEKISNTYKYIMCDETQDENNIQTGIIDILRSNIKNICIVGDDAQSIYKFRGTNVRNFLSFPERYPETKKITLFRNYRSSQEILDLANNVMNEHMTEGIKKEMQGQFHGDMPEVINVANQNTEAEYVLNKIKLLKAEGLNYSDIAVLERMSTQSLFLEGLLAQSNIPYIKYGGIKFLERSDVVDILSYLRVIVNPTDELAWYRVLKIYEGIGNTYAEKLSKLAVEKKYELLLDNPYKTYKFASILKSLYNTILSWRDMDMPISDVIEHYVEYKRELAKIANPIEKTMIDTAFNEEKDELMILAGFRYSSLAEFLDSFILDQNIEAEETDAVVISTIHSAKGLEWDTVFLLDTVDGYSPMVDFCGIADEEELRCFYVAITRPKNRLYLMQPDMVVKWGKPESAILSRYLKRCEDYYIFKKVSNRPISA